MKLKTLHDALIHELQDLHSAETQLIKALPKMQKAASNHDLCQAFEDHLEETKIHAERLEEILTDLDSEIGGDKCKAMEGLIKEGEAILKEEADSDVLDALIISIAQKVEHYEIAGYGTARTFAERLGLSDAAETLQSTLDEELAADEKLTEVAESEVNEDAA